MCQQFVTQDGNPLTAIQGGIALDPGKLGTTVNARGWAESRFRRCKSFSPSNESRVIGKALESILDQSARSPNEFTFDEIPDSGRIILSRLFVRNFHRFSHAVSLPSVAGP
jgi:hypothetical protein